MLSKKAKKNISYAILMVGTLCVILYMAYKRQEEFKEGSAITPAKITAWRDATKGAGVWLSYEFYVGDVKYAEETKCEGLDYTEAPAVVGKWLPLIYATKNPDNHTLFVHRNQYQHHNLQVPDSLEAVQKLLDAN